MTTAAMGMAGLGALVVAAPAASAAGNGYSPSGTGSSGTTAPGLPGSVVSVVTLQPSGGTATAVIGNVTITVDVPAGTFAVPTQLAVTDATSSAVTPPSGQSAVVVTGIGFYQDGSKVAGTFGAVTVTISSPSITAQSAVYVVVGSSLQPAQADTAAGSVSFTIASDPTVEVATPPATASSTVIPDASTVHTGQPFLLEGAVAGLLVLSGGAVLGWEIRRRRAVSR